MIQELAAGCAGIRIFTFTPCHLKNDKVVLGFWRGMKDFEAFSNLNLFDAFKSSELWVDKESLRVKEGGSKEECARSQISHIVRRSIDTLQSEGKHLRLVEQAKANLRKFEAMPPAEELALNDASSTEIESSDDDSGIELAEKLAEFLEIPPESITEQMCIKLVNKHGMLLNYIPDEMKTDAVCLTATQKDVRAFRYVPESKQTRKLCLLVHKKLENLFEERSVDSISDEEFRDLCCKALGKIDW